MMRTIFAMFVLSIALLSAGCRKNAPAEVAAVPINKVENAAVSVESNSLKREPVTLVENEQNRYSDSGVKPLEKGPLGYKILPVTKITSFGDSKISKDEIDMYLSKYKNKHGLPNNKDSCCNKKQNDILAWINENVFFLQQSPDGTFRHLIWGASGRKEESAEFIINYYYIKHNGVPIDSLLFLPYHWSCPDYRVFQLYPSDYPFLNINGNFNYIGMNQGAAAVPFPLKPYIWDEGFKEFTWHIPSIPPMDSSSLVSYSREGYEISYKEHSCVKPELQEKKCILESLLAVTSNCACFTTLTMQKLATVHDVSRFTGLMGIKNIGYKMWYIADVYNDHCDLKVFEIDQLAYDCQFYCAYSFGEDNLPDIFIWKTTKDNESVNREIYYKSNTEWVHTQTMMEYTGDCYEEAGE